MTELNLDSIEIINSIPSDQSQTAIHIYDHIRDIRTGIDNPGWDVHLHRVESSTDFVALLDEITKRTAQTAAYPIVHIESHGWDESLQFSDGSLIFWPDLSPFLRCLNQATRNNLLLICAACRGFHAIKTLLDSIAEGAAVRMVIGPEETVMTGILEDALKALYSSFLENPDVEHAMKDAQKVEKSMRVLRAEDAFIDAYRHMLDIEAKSAKSKREKIEELVSKAKEVPDLKNIKGLHGMARQALRAHTPESHFDRIKRSFFMLDDFPEVEPQVGYITLDFVRSIRL